MKRKIHVFGASGSGTTTIAKQACEQLGYTHFDSDDFFWLQTKEPFTVERPQNECLQLMEQALSNCDQWILSGSLTGWGDILVPFFDLVVFVYVPQDIRMERLKKREFDRYGEKIFLGGERYESCMNFLNWASAYDDGTRNGRSLPKHKEWLTKIECPVIQIVNHSLEDSVDTVVEEIKKV